MLLITLLLINCSRYLPKLDFKQKMVDFVINISTYAKSKDSTFYIFPQNASGLWNSLGYLAAVDGIGQEDLYYGYSGDGEKTSRQITKELETNLAEYVKTKKLVLTTDYVFENNDTPSFSHDELRKINDAYFSSHAKGFVPYCTVRELSYLNVNPEKEPSPNTSPIVLDSVRDFIYILQHSQSIGRQQFLDSLAKLGFDLIIMDYADNGIPYTASEISTLKHKSNAILLAYMSIGEAEDYRFYWKQEWTHKSNRPSWIEGENPDWKGNYLVRYWEKPWQRLIFGSPSSYLDIIISQGFDGIYLDKIDSYENFLNR